jgi:His/Glu/Gln/Arg/opine family amino acid ABC transporter permease subunit
MSFIIETLSSLYSGLLVTISLVACSVPLGLVIGVMIALARNYGGLMLSPFAWVYQVVFRGTPLLVQLFIIYYGLPRLGQWH